MIAGVAACGGRLAIVSERERGGAYVSFDEFLTRLRGQPPLNPRAVRNLVMIGAFDALGEPRRRLSGAGRSAGTAGDSDASSTPKPSWSWPPAPHGCPQINEEERTPLEYRISDLSTRRHLVEFYRERMRALGALTSAEANRQPDGSRTRVAGLVITRQAQSTAGRIRFFTLEDEHGHGNVTIKPDVYQRFRREASQPILVIDGVVQKHDGVWSLLATAITPLPHRTRSRLTRTITGRGLSSP